MQDRSFRFGAGSSQQIFTKSRLTHRFVSLFRTQRFTVLTQSYTHKIVLHEIILMAWKPILRAEPVSFGLQWPANKI